MSKQSYVMLKTAYLITAQRNRLCKVTGVQPPVGKFNQL